MSDSPWSRTGATPDHTPHNPHNPQWYPPPSPWPPTAWNPPPATAPRKRNGWLIACMVTIAVVVSLGFIAPFAFTVFLTTHYEDTLQNSTGGKTSDILADNLDVTIGRYTPRRDSYTAGGNLDVTFKNKGTEQATFDVTLEAVDDQGRRIDEVTTYANDLAQGQSFTKKAIIFPDDAKAAADLEHATFRILSVTMR